MLQNNTGVDDQTRYVQPKIDTQIINNEVRIWKNALERISPVYIPHKTVYVDVLKLSFPVRW